MTFKTAIFALGFATSVTLGPLMMIYHQNSITAEYHNDVISVKMGRFPQVNLFSHNGEYYQAEIIKQKEIDSTRRKADSNLVERFQKYVQ